MKNIFLPGLLFLCPAAFSQQQTAIIKGTLEHIKEAPAYIYYSYEQDAQQIRDSTRVSGRDYTFSVHAAMPLVLSIRVRSFKDRSLPRSSIETSLFIQEGINRLISADSFVNISTPGLPANNEYRRLTALTEPVSQEMTQLYDEQRIAIRNKDTTATLLLQEKINIAVARYNKLHEDYARNNPTSPIALYALANSTGMHFDADTIAAIFDRFGSAVKNSEAGIAFREKTRAVKAGSRGTAPVFTQPDIDGKELSLESLKGKYVLLDFWASWCWPCRAQSPQLLRIYNRFKEKQFTILSVSLDKAGARAQWINAVKQDQMTWYNVSELNGFDNSAAKLYNIHQIPQNILIDPQGKIAGRNWDPDKLEKKLEAVLP